MNNSLKSTIIGCIVAVVASVLISLGASRDSHAVEIGTNEQYKMLDQRQFMNNRGSFNCLGMEAELNKLGEQGWRVRACLANEVILYK